ncbi:MAG: glycoside hydrolase family 5 protein [Oscillospiraceae bacterium]|nr:glycoside hydrolase family 5 protein [Oscillospiraceae bacterium]
MVVHKNGSGDGLALWTDVNNQNDLVTLWTSIATRYKNEPTIMGYDLVNEPCPVRLDSETTQQAYDKWGNLASRIATGIRSVDSNHILFVEPVSCVFNQSGNKEYSVPSRIFVYRGCI